ncbi:membrane fusion protein, multidrug efflux system [bacterium A37T11]|nr:membrane fusion protein, multidrug efflux system [bacterium A37T11]
MKKKTIYLIIILIIIIGALSYWISGRNGKTKIGEPKGKGIAGGVVQVNGVKVSGQDFANIVTVSGSVEPNEQVQIRSEVSGLIRNLSFAEGTQVKKGQVLFAIDDSELLAQLSKAETTEKLSAENERRASLLLQKEAISVQEYDVAHADYESSKAQTQLIRAQLAKTKVKAPFDGRIGLRNVSLGEYLTPTTVVANLLSTNPVKILFAVPEKYSSQMKKGQEIHFNLSGSNQKYTAKVYAIEPGIDAATRTLQIKALADNSQGTIVPGAFAQVEIPISQVKEAVLIPSEAVIPVQNGKQAFVYKNGLARATMIETETRTSTSVLVTNGIAVGDTVITSGTMSLKDSVKVKVKMPDDNNTLKGGKR